jgi:hypothetical protein
VRKIRPAKVRKRKPTKPKHPRRKDV